MYKRYNNDATDKQSNNCHFSFLFSECFFLLCAIGVSILEASVVAKTMLL